MQSNFIFNNKWLDLLFENRNQAYGAYVLRRRQPKNVLIGLFLSATLFIAISLTGFYLNKFSANNIDKIMPDANTVREIYRNVIMAAPKVATSETIKKTSSQKQLPVKNLIPVVKNKVQERTDTKNEIKPDKEFTEIINEGKSNIIPATITSTPSAEKSVKEPYLIPQKMPEFPGGELALINFIQHNTQYPRKHIQEDISGTVWISFIIDANGDVKDIKVFNGIENYPEFSYAAIESLTKMPRWIPGQQNGINVPVLYKVPVRFSLIKSF